MRRIVSSFILALVLAVVPAVRPSAADAQEDRCRESGIVVKNLTTLDRWYRKNGGDCFKWKRNKIFVIKPGDTVEIFSDLTCETAYCKEIDYEKYLSYDADADCRVKIIPGCTISDM